MIATPRQQTSGGKLLDFSRYETSQREVSLARLRHAGLLRKSAAVERGEFHRTRIPLQRTWAAASRHFARRNLAGKHESFGGRAHVRFSPDRDRTGEGLLHSRYCCKSRRGEAVV
jgi:hypothetical protein